jgi:mRNA-degrading endonuclease toxin of MazEF toxin-antitoxin module
MTTTQRITPEVREQLEPGDLVKVNLNPVVGSETANYRPWMVISAQAVNAVSRTVTIVPITHGSGKIMRMFPVLGSSQNDAGIDGTIVLTQMNSVDLVEREALLVGKITDEAIISDVRLRLAAYLGITASLLDSE